MAAITAQNLLARTQLDAGGPITLPNPGNAVHGDVTLSALNTAGTAPAAGGDNFVDSTGFTVVAQPGNGLNGQEIGVNTADFVTLRTSASGTLAVNGSINSTSGVVELMAGTGGIAINGPVEDGAMFPTIGVRLISAGNITETASGSIVVQDLEGLTENDAGAAIALTSPANAVSNRVTLNALNAAGNGVASGSISFVDSSGFNITGSSVAGKAVWSSASTRPATLRCQPKDRSPRWRSPGFRSKLQPKTLLC